MTILYPAVHGAPVNGVYVVTLHVDETAGPEVSRYAFVSPEAADAFAAAWRLIFAEDLGYGAGSGARRRA